MPSRKPRSRNADSSSSESDEHAEDHVQPYVYETLHAPRSTRLLILQPGRRKDEIVCKIREVDLDPQYTNDVQRVEELLKEKERKRIEDRKASMAGSITPNPLSTLQTRETDFEDPLKARPEDPPHPRVPGLGQNGAPAEYEALSWSWGSTPWDAQIKIDRDGVRYSFDVPQAIIGAFTALRNKRTERVLWVDALSIDQKSDPEKSQQVPMMSEIYGGSKSVCVWLGEGDQDSKVAFDFIQNEIIKLEDFDKLCESPGSAPKWNAMFNLMKRPWFSRRWIVQEIALARQARLYCGRRHIPWQDFADAVQLFVSVESATHRLSEVMKIHDSFYHVPRWFEYVSKLGASLLVDATGTLFRYSKIEWTEPTGTSSTPTKASMQLRSDSSRNISSRNNRQALLSLEHLVSTLSIFQATNPRDIIYALLAVAKDTNPIPAQKSSYITDALKSITVGMKLQARPYTVDYTKRYVDICADFVQFAINQQPDRTRALDIICRPWAPEPKKESRRQLSAGATSNPGKTVGFEEVEEVERLPSWIPQLLRASHNMIQHADSVRKVGRINADPLVGLPGLQRNYNAAGDKSADLTRIKIKKRKNYHSIDAIGFVLDRVVEVDKQSQNGNIPRSWFEKAHVNVNPFGYPDDDPEMKDHWDEFWRTLVADRGQSGRNPPAYYARAFQMSLKKGLLATGSLNTTDMIDHGRCSVVSEFFRRVQAVIWNRCLITTENGRLGILNEGCEAGDLVCILDGCSVPVILRPKLKDKSELKEDMLAEEEELEKWSTVAQRRHRLRNQEKKPLAQIVKREKERLEEEEREKKKTTASINDAPQIRTESPPVFRNADLSLETETSAVDSPKSPGSPRSPHSTVSEGGNAVKRHHSARRSRAVSIPGRIGYRAQSQEVDKEGRAENGDAVAGQEKSTTNYLKPNGGEHPESANFTPDDDRTDSSLPALSVPRKPLPKRERTRVWKEYYCELMGEAFIYGVMDGEAIGLYNKHVAQRGESAAQQEPQQPSGEGNKRAEDKYKGYRDEGVVDGVRVLVAEGSMEDQFPPFRNQVFELR